MNRTIPTTLALLLTTTATATDRLDQWRGQLHRISPEIAQHADQAAITESLYRQFRPRVRITDPTLDSATIDQRTRDYIAQMYTPTLIRNYAQVYAALAAARQPFAACDQPTPIDPQDDVQKSLCLEDAAEQPTVRYLSNPYGQGWKSTARFRFAADGDALRLIAIDVPDEHGAEVYIKGL